MSALVMGQIVNLAVKEGDHVKKGQLLLQIDRAAARGAGAGAEASLEAMRHDLDAAKSTAAQAKLDYERASQQHKGNILAEADMQRAKSNLDTAEATLAATESRMNSTMADLAASRDTLSKTTVTAPIEGIVTSLPVKEGEVTVIGTMNNAGTQLMTISDMGSVEAVMMVDETSVPGVKIGQKAVLSIDAYPNRKFEGTVDGGRVLAHSQDRPGPPDPGRQLRGDQLQGEDPARQSARHDPPRLLGHGGHRHRPGATAPRRSRSRRSSSATSRRRTRRRRSAAPRPRKASTRSRTASCAFSKVKTGIAGELMIEVTEGPKPGQEIVTGPFKVLRQVKDGDRVIIEKEGDKKKGGSEARVTTSELFRVSAAALTRHKLRAFLTLLGVIIGVATVVGVVSVISGLNSYVKDKVIGLNPDIVIFTKYGIITSREEWLMARRRRDITLTDMEVVRRECVKCAQVGARGDRRAAGQVRRPQAPAGRDPGPHGQHGRGDEVRHRQRPVLHRDRVQPLDAPSR